MTTGHRPPEDAAVSSVLGAVLVFGLIVVTLVVVQTSFVPRWDEDREARLGDRMVDQLSLFKSDAERLATNATVGGVRDPLTLASGGRFTFFESARSGSSAAFEPSASGQGVGLTSPLLRLVERDGQGLFGLGEAWEPIATGTVEDIQSVDHLRIRITDPGSETDDDSTTLRILNETGAYAGKAVLTFFTDSASETIETAIYGATSQTTPITVGFTSYKKQVDPEFVFINLLDDELLFAQVLAAAAVPFDLVLEPDASDPLAADYAVAYTEIGGASSGNGGGLSIPNYATTLASGSLAVEADFQRLPEQTFVVEHGAIIVVQDSGAAMLVSPSVSITSTDDQVVVDWVVPGLDGPTSALGGQRAATLAVAGTGIRTQIEGFAARLTITLPTTQATVWSDHLDTMLAGAGLSDSGTNPEYKVECLVGAVVTPCASATSVALTVFGPDSAPADTTEDVFLRYQQATIDFELLPAG